MCFSFLFLNHRGNKLIKFGVVGEADACVSATEVSVVAGLLPCAPQQAVAEIRTSKLGLRELTASAVVIRDDNDLGDDVVFVNLTKVSQSNLLMRGNGQ